MKTRVVPRRSLSRRLVVALCAGFVFAVADARAADAAADPGPRRLEWRVSCGHDLPPRPGAAREWREMSLELRDDRSGRHLHIGLSERGAMPLVWRGDPGPEAIAEVKALFARLPHPPEVDWPSTVDRAAFDKMKPEYRYRKVCAWTLAARHGTPRGRDAARDFHVRGLDRNEAGAPRHAFDEPMAAHLAALAERLQKTMPKRPSSLSYSVRGADGVSASYLLHVREGRAHLARDRAGSLEWVEADPALIERLAALTRRHKVDAWHGFAPPALREKTPGAFDLKLGYDTGQGVWVRGLREGADGASRPEGFAAFERELTAALDETLDGPSGAPPAPRRRGLKEFAHSIGNGYARTGLSYRVAPRREAGRDVFRLVRRTTSGDDEGARESECVLTDADMTALESILARRGTAKWDGFRGTNRNVKDGDGFTFSLEYTDGRTVRARGYESWPKGYGEAMREILGHLDGVLKRCADGRPPRK